RVRRPSRAAVAERQAPEPIDLERLVTRDHQRTAKLPVAVRLLVIGVDHAVAEVAHQQIVTEGPKSAGASANPQGALRAPLVATRATRFPLVSNRSTIPCVAPRTSFTLA